MKHLFIVNPAAGGKLSAEEKRAMIEPYAAKLTEPWEIYMTAAPMDACAKAREECGKGESIRIYSCGGDGTLNEVINGVYGFDNAEVTVFPCGTGNDFIKIFGGKQEQFRNLDALIGGESIVLDLMDCNGRKCINICSIGIDARIGCNVHKYSHIPLIGGKGGYLISLVVNVVKGIGREFRTEVDGVKADRSYTLCCVCNGQFYGGFFHPSPNADPTDGKLETLLIDKVSRLGFMRLVGRYSKGKHSAFSKIACITSAEKVSFESEGPILINADGEALSGTSVEITVIPAAVRFVLPKGMTAEDLVISQPG